MNKLVRFLVHLAVSIAYFVAVYLISTLTHEEALVDAMLGAFMMPGFILIHIGCDVLRDHNNWFTKFLHHAFKWLGIVIISAIGLIAQFNSALEIKGQTLNPIINGFASPWLVLAFVTIMLYTSLEDEVRGNWIPFIPLIGYGVSVAFTMLLGVMGRYVMNIFYAWFPLIVLLLFIIFAIVAAVASWDVPTPDFKEILNKKNEKKGLIDALLKRLMENITIIDPNYRKDKVKYMTWESTNNRFMHYYFDSDDHEHKISVPGKVTIDVNAVENPISPDEVNDYCKEYIIKELKKILADNPTVYGPKHQWVKDDWENVSVYMKTECK